MTGQETWQDAPIHEEPAPETQCATQPAPAQLETSDAPQLAVQSLVSNSAETEATHPDSVPSSGQGNRQTVMQNLPTETRLVLTSVQDIYWAPPPPEKLKGTWRGIKEILEITAKWKSTSAAWNKFDNIATNLSDDRTLAHLPWTNILSELIDTAFHHQRDESPTSITFSKWQKAVVSQDMDTIDGLSRFLTRWTETDQLVKQWVTREMLVSRASADLGGWLADYVNTTYLLLTKCAKTGVVYKVVHNQVYASLAKQLEEFFPKCKIWSDNSIGNVLEHLCWHAFERSDTEAAIFVLAVIWNTTNRMLENPPSANPSQSSVAKPSDKLTQSTPTQIETSDAPQLPVQSLVSIPAETEATHPDTQFATQLVPAQLATSDAPQLPVWNPAEWQIFFPS